MHRTPALAFSVLALSACAHGGDGGEGDRLSRDEFVSQASEICDRVEGEIDEVETPDSTDEIPAYVDEILRKIEDGRVELRELKPPEELEARYIEFIAAGEETLETANELKQAAAEGDEAEVQRIRRQASEEDEEADKIARDLGLDACAELNRGFTQRAGG